MVVAQTTGTMPGSMFMMGVLVLMRVHVADPGPNRDHRQEEDRRYAADKDVCCSSQTDASSGVKVGTVALCVKAPAHKVRNGAGELGNG